MLSLRHFDYAQCKKLLSCKQTKQSFILFLLASSAVYATSTLECLWEKAKNYHVNVLEAEKNYEFSKLQVENKSALYPVSVSVGAASTWTDSLESEIEYPSSISGSLNVTKTFPKNAKLSTSLSYNFSRGMAFSDDFSDFDVGYAHIPQVNVSLSKSLFSYKKYGIVGDVRFQDLVLEKEQNKLQKENTQKSILQEVAFYFVNYRKYERTAENSRMQLDFYSRLLEANTIELANGHISQKDIWEIEKNYNDAVEKLNESIENLSACKKNLLLYCGTIEDIENKKNTQSDFPEFYEKAKKDLMLELLLNNTKQLNSAFVQSKESIFPILSVGVGFSENTETKSGFKANFIDDKANLNWNVSVSVDFPDVFSPKNSLMEKKYEFANEKMKCEIENYEKNAEAEKTQYDEFIKLYARLEKETGKIQENYEKYCEDLENQFLEGQISKMDLISAQTELFVIKNTKKNYEDLVWYYTWMRSQIYG